MAWDSPMRRDGKNDAQMAHIVYSRVVSKNTKDGIKYSLGGLYIYYYVTLVSQKALKRIKKKHPQMVIEGKDVDSWKLHDLEKMWVTREYVIPVSVLYSHLAERYEHRKFTEAYILGFIPKLQIALIIKKEERKLRLAHLSCSMPGRDNWWGLDKRNPLARYRAAVLDDSLWVKKF